MKKLLLILIIILPFTVFASEQAIWVDAEGSSLMSDADTFKEVATRAKNDALRNAAENAAGVFIKSRSFVSNSQLGDDLIYASVKGKVLKYDVVSEGWDAESRNLYVVKLKALVEPLHYEKNEGLTAELTLSRQELKENDEIRIFYKTNEDAYVYIFSVAADGSVTLLMPNLKHKDNRAKAGVLYEFPDVDSGMMMQAKFLPDFKGAFAEERVKIIATLKDEELLTLGFREGVFEVYDAGSTGLISDLVRRLNKIDPEEWAEATAFYKIVR